MEKMILIKDAVIINEGEEFKGSLLTKGAFIQKLFRQNESIPDEILQTSEVIHAEGKFLMPGIIDDQVHFREPGLTHKADIYTEAKAAIAGGITSYMEMPNTNPQTTTQRLLEEKYTLASEKSLANYSFYIGATNDNLDELLKTDPRNVCGIKIFMGSSTGNMLVDKRESLEQIFKHAPVLIAVHCEDEETIRSNMAKYMELYKDGDIPIALHPIIRSAEACFLSSSMAIELAKKYGTRLHILHLSTSLEMHLFENQTPIRKKQITGEVCVHHLWFDDRDYAGLGTRIKWNPAIKTQKDKEKLLECLLNDTIDVIATDHAPHTLEEKNNIYVKAPSGGPLVQHSLNVMLELRKQGIISLTKIVEKMSHHPAEIFRIDRRGFIRESYYADLILVDPDKTWTVEKENILYKCQWSPFEGHTFTGIVTHTLVNGNLVYKNGSFNEDTKGMRLAFNR